ncbi:MAG: tetratricopeptide repeat protein [Proteobacteria bacterium]|nr:tetratricopeptide repeat protein [Pseudomonadota bacterium]
MADDGKLVRSELERLLGSEFLRRSPSHLRLLRYLVERRLAGDTGALREMAIGIEVFQRNPATFDPKNDPIVRVNASRLRERLMRHYAMFDTPPQLRIELPKGRYVPEFIELGTRTLMPPRFLVLPVVSEPADDALATLLFESMIGELQALLQVQVLGSRSARAVADDEPLDSARRLNAHAVLSSRLLRVAATEGAATVPTLHTLLLSAPYGHMLASHRYERAAGESDARFVERVSRLVRDASIEALVDLLPGEYTPPAQRRGFQGVDGEAADAYVAARRESALGTADGHRQARRLLEAAIARSPDFAMAHAALASTLGNLSMYEQITPEEAWRLGSAASRRALELDPLEPGAYLNLAGDKIYYEYDFAAARELLRQALTLAPRQPGVHLLLGTIASYEARLDEALQHLDAAQELDPLYPAIRANRGVAWLFCGHYTEAARVFSELLALHPQRNATRVSLANALTLLGETDAAQRELDAVLEREPADAAARLGLAVLAARDGRKQEARSRIDAVRADSGIERTNPSALASAYAQLGDAAEAMRWLALAAECHEGGFAEAQVDPLLAPLAPLPEFRTLLAAHGLRPLHANAATSAPARA